MSSRPNLWNKAIELDPKASAMILSIMKVSGQVQHNSKDEDQVIDENHMDVLQSLFDRMRENEGSELGDASSR